MKFIVSRNNHKDIIYKDNDGRCTYRKDEVDYECLIIGMSSNGTYVLETIEENNENRNL